VPIPDFGFLDGFLVNFLACFDLLPFFFFSTGLLSRLKLLLKEIVMDR
jgi:hypothetical protein